VDARETADAKLDGHGLLQRGITLHREAAFAASVAALEQARQTGALEAAEQTECAFYLAADYVAMNSLPAARRELRLVIEAQPGYELPQYTSPKVASLFREVRDEAEKVPRLRAMPPRRRSAGRIELWFDSSRSGGMVFGAAMWRWRGDASYREEPLAHVDDKLVATIELDRAGTLEYYAEARGPSGLGRAASREQPLELPITGAAAIRESSSLALTVTGAPPPDRKRSIANAWWLWTPIAIVAAGGIGVGLYFALRPQSAGTGDAVLDFQVK